MKFSTIKGQSLALRKPQATSTRASARRPLTHNARWGFTEDFEQSDNSDIVVPQSMYGLSYSQMAAMGLTASEIKRPEPSLRSLTAKAHYVGDAIDDELAPKSGVRRPTSMAASNWAGSPPPDLPSLLLDGRIVYVGMPIVPSVAELVISELLWLNFSNGDKPIYMYINSTGSQRSDGQAVAFETDAMAILDTMNYIRPEVHTLCVGQAHGNAALLLAAGKKGKRFSLPHARIMTAPPRQNRSFGKAVDQAIRAAELEYSTQTYAELMAKHTGRDLTAVRKDIGRNRYFTPEQAIEYGIVDRIVSAKDDVRIERQDYEGAMKAQSSGRRGGPSRGPEAGN